MINTLYLPELREMLGCDDREGLTEFCTALHPARTADFMSGLTAAEAWRVLAHAEMPLRVEIFGYFDPAEQIEILESQERQEVAAMVAELAPDDRVDLLQEADQAVVDELLPMLPADERADFLRLRAYPEGTAGAVMTTDVAQVSETMTVHGALEELSRLAEDLETIYYIYAVGEGGRLRGVVSARQLVSAMARPGTILADLMETDLTIARPFEDQEQVAHKVARFDLLAIPVVDSDGNLLGIITHDDVMDVVREEATEDAHRIAAVDPLEESYLTTHIFTLSWKRGMWLTILFVGALLTALALAHYEEGFEQYGWLVLFIPLVISSGGNSGSQSATLIITALAVGDVTLRDWAKIVRRELMMGLLLGGFLAMLGVLPALLVTNGDWRKAAVVPITLVLVVVTGALLGSLLPLLFRRLGLDPAMMSNPFVAGIIDILGIVIYMNVALAML
ncbi:MAG: magnesium transporter [Pirellulaceae bacterium]|jgi:magnesium transporter|nr:magnesium transporter [Pirellulaceae bacterium]MDP7017838.1 magnesium transporter [Pirellulaceae bacterium]